MSNVISFITKGSHDKKQFYYVNMETFNVTYFVKASWSKINWGEVDYPE